MANDTDRTTPAEFMAESFGRRLRQARVELGLTQTDMAYILGVHQHEISDWERGIHVPTLIRIYQILDRLGIDDRAVLVRQATPATA